MKTIFHHASARVLIMTIMTSGLPLAATGADPFLLQAENPTPIGNWKITTLGEGGAETGSIPDGFLSAGVALDLLNIVGVRAGMTAAWFPDQGIVRIGSLDCSIRMPVWKSGSAEIQAILFGLLYLGDPIWTVYSGSLTDVIYALSPRAEGGYDVGAGAAGRYDFGSTGLSLYGNLDAAFTGGRGVFRILSDPLSCIRLRADAIPAYRINQSWSAALQNRIVFWFSRGFSYEILPQAQFDVLPGLSVSAGAGIPVVGGSVWRFLAGARWTPSLPARAPARSAEPAPPPAPATLVVIRENDDIRIRVYFNFLGDKADLFEPQNREFGSRNRAIVADLVSYLRQFPDYDITVEGHTNRVKFDMSFEKEQESEMLPLAGARADAVVQALTTAGIDGGRLSPAAIGGLRPLARFEDAENCWKNRRVEIVLKRRK